ncbi:hypothetical protein Tco_1575353 [Tanacetum coccineum]
MLARKFYPAVAQCSLQAIIKWDGNDQATTKNGAKEVLIGKEMVLIMIGKRGGSPWLLAWCQGMAPKWPTAHDSMARTKGLRAVAKSTGSGGAIGSCHREKSKENRVWHQIWYGTRIQWSGEP